MSERALNPAFSSASPRTDAGEPWVDVHSVPGISFATEIDEAFVWETVEVASA
jgi:hypothetical protein